ncbi:Thiol:disulfide interchange protein DsbD [Massilia sp. Bi118]|uniref:protein-disulfide reductase DsbD n=1 Tax=Massilia sp. Bi118 TaxID=2822346 RepID=UPI001D2CAB95|nr:protein-disulfide reductase DsbD [Massilia sp. Bi118]CAH0200675.1 Thiol:disulfide interchange protein DsbD [Massilia sp. Bi118]
MLRFLLSLFASLVLLAPAHAEDDFLPPEQAFRLSARMLDPHTAEVSYAIADGYYMYRERFKFSAAGAKLGEPQIPPGKVKFDETFNKDVETYHHSVAIRIPVQGEGPFTLNVTGQGCADKGLCYPPQDASVRLVAGGGGAGQSLPQTSVPPGQSGSGSLGSTPAAEGASGFRLTPSSTPPAAVQLPAGRQPAAGAQPAAAGAATPSAEATLAAVAPANVPAASNAATTPAAATTVATAPSELSGIAALLQGGRLLAIVPAFILLGLGLAFTPCVLPMVPILSSIIVGEGQQTGRGRGFILSLSYSLGMAIVYTLLGVAAGLLGEGLAAALQNPWVLGAFGLLIAAMSLSMFGVFQLQVPAALQTRLADASGRQASGKLAGVFVMGAISALIVGPCVAAPLAGALVYISQTRDVLIGGAALFAMAIGMSVPLLLVGVSAGSLLPRAGMWMESVKRFFGVLMLAMALWMTAPVLPGLLQMLLWAALLLGYGFYLLRGSVKRHWAGMALGAALAVLGAVQLVGLASGARDPLAPLARFTGGAPAQQLAFTRIKTVEQLDQALAATNGKTAMLDFYADWCVSCKEMEKLTFVDPAVKARLADTVLLQVDVTANDAADRAMLKRFGLFGPPGIILFDRSGREIADGRVIGYQDSAKFLASLAKLQ